MDLTTEKNDTTNTKKSYKKIPDQTQEHWLNTRWRPMMGWMYFCVCIFDFILAPILWGVLQAVVKAEITQWTPLTLQGAGLFHIAMGAIVGITAYGRTKEKITSITSSLEENNRSSSDTQ